jgi:hypothetical protein
MIYYTNIFVLYFIYYKKTRGMIVFQKTDKMMFYQRQVRRLTEMQNYIFTIQHAN